MLASALKLVKNGLVSAVFQVHLPHKTVEEGFRIGSVPLFHNAIHQILLFRIIHNCWLYPNPKVGSLQLKQIFQHAYPKFRHSPLD